jgi:hypothetical protein
MTVTSQNFNRFCKRIIAAMAVLIAVGGAASVALADDPVVGPCPPSGGPPGAVFTSDLDCKKVNGNIYTNKTDVYLNGGSKAADRLNGNYYVRVLSPSNTLLGQSSGLVAFSPANCLQLWSIVFKASDSTEGYDDTDNNGGEYKVEVSCDPGFVSSSTKSDNFKVRENFTGCEGVKVVCLSCPISFSVDCQGHVGPENAVGALVTLPEPIVTGGLGGNSEECTINGVVKSGEIFIAQGTTVTVTCTVIDGAGNTDTCSYDITVDTCPQCTLTCPIVPDVCADLAGCQAVVTWDPPVCPEAGVTVTSSGGNSGDTFGLGSHTVTYTAKMDVDQSVLSTCDVTFKVVAPAQPQITSCPTVPAVNGAGQCSATATFTPPTATGNCNGSAITVVCDHLSGSSFPIGTTKVTCSTTDVCGQSASCFFNVVVKGQICVTKFYDSDFSGAKNGSEVVIPNWKITLSDGQCAYTGADGKVCFNVVAGTYTVTEELKTGYIATAGTTRTGVLVDSTHCNPSVCIGNVKVANTGALTMGFWQNKNGQGIITSYCAPVGHTSLCAFLRGYAPFQDLSATANCTAVASYVTTIIKAANASGAAMNAMLKAQMLATALDVYFSDATLGGVKISAPSGPIGSVSVDLQAVCKMIDNPTTGSATCSGIYQNVSAAFGGAPCLTVSQILAYAASQSNVGGTTWYVNVKATQELAKNTFDAINNQVALACGP